MIKENVDKIIELRKKNVGYKKIAKEIGISQQKVSQILIENGYTSHVTMPSEDVVDSIVNMYQNEHKGSKAIAAKFKMSAERVRAVLRVKGIDINPSAYHNGYQDKIDHNFFETIDTERKAYWLGLLFADGYNNEKFYQIEITLKKEDEYILKCLKDDTKSTYDIFDKNVYCNGKLFHESRLTLYSKKMSEDLNKTGCIQNKSLVLKFPAADIIPINLQNHFIRGYFDGDGYISGSKIMLNGTKSFLQKCVDIIRVNTNISLAERWYMDGKAYRWQHASAQDMKKIFDYLYKDATIFLKRKYQRFLEV